MGEELEQFLAPAPGIQCEPAEVVDLARRVVRGAAGDLEAAEKLFVFVRDQVAYSPYVPFHRIEDYWALNVLARGKGYCVQKAALLTALARALGMPARLCFAHIRNHLLPEGMLEMLGTEVMDHHCYSELFAGGRWLALTPSFDQALTKARGWRLVEFNAEGPAMLPATDLAGRPHISYLEKLGWRVGVPLQEMMAGWRQCYGGKRVDGWIAAVTSGGEWGGAS